MNTAKPTLQEPAPDAHWITYAFYPWDEYTQAEIHLVSRVGGVRSDLALWADHLGIGRRDLAGRSPQDVALMLGDELWRRLHTDSQADLQRNAVASGVPLGTVGGTVSQDSLPGL